jgi:hypothetical protein
MAGIAGRHEARRLFTRVEWRTRWQSYLLIAGVIAVTVAAVLALLLGAARTDRAFKRLRAATNASDVNVGIDDPNTKDGLIAALRAIDGVGSLAVFDELFVRPQGSNYFPDYDLLAIAPRTAQDGRTLDVPVITRGRAADPARDDEVMINDELARALRVSPGDRISLESMSRDWIHLTYNGGDAGPPDGPRVAITVVGIARGSADFGRLKAVMYLTPAFTAHYGADVNSYQFVEATASEAARDRLHREGLAGFPDAEVGPSQFADDATTDTALGTIATALRWLAGAVAAAGSVGIGAAALSIARSMRRRAVPLVALGWTARDTLVASVGALAPWLVTGVAGGVLVGIIGSPRTLIDLARQADPASGAVVVYPVIIVAVAAVASAAIAGLVAVSWRRPSVIRAGNLSVRQVVAPLGRPLALVLGGRNALWGPPANGGLRSRASRGALAVAAAAVAAAIATVIVSASIGRLQHEPALSGRGPSRIIDSGESVDLADRALSLFAKDDRVASFAAVHISFGISIGQGDDVTTMVYDLRRGTFDATVLRGRLPQSPDEVALGPSTLQRERASVGDTITLSGPAGRGGFHIVGSVLFPEGDLSFDDGAALTLGGGDLLLGTTHDAAQLHSVQFRWEEVVNAAAADAQLADQGMPPLTADAQISPGAVTNLGRVRQMPHFLALFIGLLFVVTMAHTLAADRRSRARDLWTLRAMGMTPRATGGIVAAQALTVVTIAAAIGLPLGLIVGGRVWTVIADRTHVAISIDRPASGLMVTIASAFAITGIVAVFAMRRVLGTRLSEALRVE